MTGTDNKIIELLDRLLKQTEEKAIQWTLVSGGGDTYDSSFRNASIRVGSNDGDGAHPYHFMVYNDKGVAIIDAETGENPESRINTRVSKLHEAVRRQDLKVDETLDSLLQQLEEPPF